MLGTGALQSCWQHLGRAMGWAVEAGENRIGAGGTQIKLLMFPKHIGTLIQVGLELFFGCSSLLVSPQACHGCFIPSSQHPTALVVQGSEARWGL